ncbi:DUF5655 domain-containing protein [Leptospira sp. WS92.C1]
MPLFQRDKLKLTLVKPARFLSEKELQGLIENNLETVFDCKLIATEFSTGPIHSGRIDTLAISEDDNPVIIEYKVVESSQLINQSLYYLSWISDHKGDFEIAVQKAFPKDKCTVDWSSIRVICIAPEYKKYDLHAVQVMGSNIELWQYRYYENGIVFFEEIFKKSSSVSPNDNLSGKNPVMVEAGKKAAITKATGVYNFEQHINKIEQNKRHLVTTIQEFIMNLSESIEESPKKLYVAYKVSQNFVCMEVGKSKVLLFLKIKPSSLLNMPKNGRDVTNIGHFGTGDLELTIQTEQDIDISKEYIQIAYNNIGGN